MTIIQGLLLLVGLFISCLFISINLVDLIHSRLDKDYKSLDVYRIIFRKFGGKK